MNEKDWMAMSEKEKIDPKDIEFCFQCGRPTGQAKDSYDSLYINNDLGPFCWGCYWEKYVD